MMNPKARREPAGKGRAGKRRGCGGTLGEEMGRMWENPLFCKKAGFSHASPAKNS